MNYLPDLKQLATFQAVVQHGSMTNAATALGYVPSAVSQHVASLERTVGAELLVRRPGSRLAVTAAGRSLIEAASALFAATTTFSDIVQRISDAEVGDLRVGTYNTAMCHLLPDVLAEMQRGDGGPRIHLNEMETPDALPLIRSGELDVLLAYRYLPEDPPTPSGEWAVTSLGLEPLLLIASNAPSASKTLAECAENDWVIGYPHNDDRRLLNRWGSQIVVSPRIRHETEDPHSSLAMVAAGLAVSLVPAIVVLIGLRLNAAITVVPLPPDVRPPHREILTVTRARFRSAVVDQLTDRLGVALRTKIAEVERAYANHAHELVDGHMGATGRSAVERGSPDF